MKQKLALLTLLSLLGVMSSSLANAITVAPNNSLSSYNGVDYTNYYADSVLVDSGSVIEKTTAASDTSTNLSLAKSSDSMLYIGFDEKFDGIAMDVDSAATGGSYKVSYWNGSSWSTLKSTSSESIKNSSSTGVFKLTWDRPSSWDDRSIEIDSNEDGDDDTSDTLYFIRIEVVDAYDSSATISRLGVIDYNLVLDIENELGTQLTIAAEDIEITSNANDEVYAHNYDDGVHYYAFHGLGASFTYEVSKTGYVTEDDTVTLNKSQETAEVSLDYTHKIEAIDANDGDNVMITSAKAGDANVSCVIQSGDAYCPVDTDDDGESATVYASGYQSESFTLPNRTTDSTAQKVSTVEMESNSDDDDDDDDDNTDSADLTVYDLSMDDEDVLSVKVKNQGDVDANDDTYLYVYVDGDREASYKIDDNYLESDEMVSVTFELNVLEDLDEEKEVKACIDATDEVDEDNESNNCRTEEFGEDNGNDGEVDFEVTEVYGDEDNFYYTLENTGDEDANGSSSVKVKVTVEQDGDTDTVVTTSYSNTSSNDFFDAGEESTYNLGDVLEDYFDDGSDFDVTVCIDTDDNYDEDSESNNCMTVDDGDLDEHNSSESCGNFNDIEDHWAEEYICALYDRDVVDGRSSTHYYPDSTVTRAEFLKMTLLGLDYDTYEVSGVHYSDVDEDDWYYEYISYATAHDIVDGYSDGKFRPNQTITRAEAISILLKAAEQEDYNYDESDINFRDVDEDDWFAWAVVLADEYDIMNGYNNDYFYPFKDITRGEAAKIVELTYEEFTQ